MNRTLQARKHAYPRELEKLGSYTLVNRVTRHDDYALLLSIGRREKNLSILLENPRFTYLVRELQFTGLEIATADGFWISIDRSGGAFDFICLGLNIDTGLKTLERKVS